MVLIKPYKCLLPRTISRQTIVWVAGRQNWALSRGPHLNFGCVNIRTLQYNFWWTYDELMPFAWSHMFGSSVTNSSISNHLSLVINEDSQFSPIEFHLSLVESIFSLLKECDWEYFKLIASPHLQQFFFPWARVVKIAKVYRHESCSMGHIFIPVRVKSYDVSGNIPSNCSVVSGVSRA